MAAAIVRGLIAAERVPARNLRLVDVRPEPVAALAKELGVGAAADGYELAAWADVLILAIKPQVFDVALPPLAKVLGEKTLVVSIAAGVSTAAIESLLPKGTRVARVMPNTPAMVRASASGIAGGRHATGDDLTLTEQLFAPLGVVARVDERLMDAVTALSGSGPAYVLTVIEALSDGGVNAGLPRDVATSLAVQTVLGTAQLVQQSKEHPAKLREAVTSPGGTTIAGLKALEQHAVRHAFIEAVAAAAARSVELGKALQARLQERR